MNTFDGYIRRDGTNSKVLLDGGDAKALSSFIGTLSYNNNKITYTKADGSTSYDLVTLEPNITSTFFVGNSTDNSTTITALTNGNVYLHFKEGNSESKFKISGSQNITVTTDASGNIIITGPDLSGLAVSENLNNYLPLTGGKLSEHLTIHATNTYNLYDEGIRILDAPNKWAGITFGATGETGCSPQSGEVAWFMAKCPGGQFIISPNTSDNTVGITLNKDGDAKWRNNIIIHSGNIDSYAITSHLSLSNYYTKSETDTAITNKLNSVLEIKIVTSLPTSDINKKAIYLMSASNSGTNDLYREHVYINKGTEANPNWDWEILGEVKLNYSDLVTSIGIYNLQLTWSKGGVALTAIDIDAKRLLGRDLNSIYGGISYVRTDGVMKIGKYIDFHTSSDDSRDYSVRLYSTNTSGQYTQLLPEKTGTIALTSDLSDYLPLSGGVMSGIIYFNRKVDGGLIQNIYNNNFYNIVRSHNDGNISISASGGGLYLGYENTSIIYARGSYVNLDTGNLTASKSGQTLTITINGTSYSLTNSTYSVFGASGDNHSTGLVPDPGDTAGTVKFLCEDATWKQVDWSYITSIPSTFTPSAHEHNYIRGVSFYEATSIVGLGHYALPTDWKPSQVMRAVCGNNDSIPAVFAAFTEPAYRDSLFWTGYGGVGLTELRSVYNGPTNRLEYRVAYGYGADQWGNFYTIATMADLPTKSSWNYDDRYVTFVGVTDDSTNHANLLRYVLNGISNYFTVPYASVAGSVAWSNVTGRPSDAGNATTPVYWSSNAAVACTSIPWAFLSGVPSTFTPSAHTHDFITGKNFYILRFNYVGLPSSYKGSEVLAEEGIDSYCFVFNAFVNHSGPTNSIFWGGYGNWGITELFSYYGDNSHLYYRVAKSWGGANNGTNEGWLSVKTLANLSDIPTVNNSSLTLKTNGTVLTTFYANDNTDRTFNVTYSNVGAAAATHYHQYTDLRGSSTTADQAIVSSGTADGWTLKTLGSNAFNSDSYALSGHTHAYLRYGSSNYDSPKEESDSPRTICNMYSLPGSIETFCFPGCEKNSGGTRYMSFYWTGYGGAGLVELCHAYGSDGPLRFRNAVGYYNGDASWNNFREIIDNHGGQTINGNLTATNFYTTSDRNKKTNISSFSEHIRKFQLKDTKKWHYGVIAQEVEEMFRDGEEGNMTVNYNSILSYYVGKLENEVKKLRKEIKELKSKLYD